MGRPAKKDRTPVQTMDLNRAINDARELIYGACWKLIRAQDIIVDEKDTLGRLQVSVQVLRNYADQELAQITAKAENHDADFTGTFGTRFQPSG